MKRPTLSTFRSFLVAIVFLGLTIAGRAQTILPDPTEGQSYSFQLVTNPAQPAGTTYTANGLPTGLSIDPSSGVVSGVTNAVGLYKGSITFSYNSTTSSFPFQITVDPAPGTPTITSAGGIVGTVGTQLSYTIGASNGPTSYNIAQLPPGLTASGAEISGTPTTAGLFFTSISANNANGQGAILVLMFTISPAGPVPAITSALQFSSPVNAPFSFTITGTNNPTSFSATGLPAGLSLDTSTGIISGTPTSAQVAIVPILATNSYGSSLPLNLILTIGSYSAITSATTATGTGGSAFSYALMANNSPVSYNLTGLPAGLSFNSTTGAISGTPTTPGIYTLTASASNLLGVGPATALTLNVNDPASGTASPIAPIILVAPLMQSVTVGSTAQFSVTAVGTGALSYQWSLNNTPISGASSSTLSIAEVTANDAGSYIVTVTNSVGSIVSAPVSLTIVSLVVPPAITSQPDKATATVGSSASFTVGASGNGPLSFQWLFNGTPMAGATMATLALSNVQSTDAGTYSVVVSNPNGSVTSDGAVLTVSEAAFAPIFQYQPSSTSITVGGTATLLVGVVGSPPITYQWSKAGTAIAGATSPNLTFTDVALSDAGVYSVAITDPAGTVTSSNATLTVSPAGGPPVPVSIVLQPTPVTTTVGGAATFTVAVTGDAPVTYQWRKNQNPIAGATGSTFTITDVQASDAGTYDVDVANGFSATISVPALLTVNSVSMPSRLINVSARGLSGAGDQTLIIGFVVGGSGTENVLARAVGPTLASLGVSGNLADPELDLVSSSTGATVASNESWGGTSALSAVFTQVGAYPLPADSLDSAFVTSLQSGGYTALAHSVSGGTGIVLVEAYDADTSPDPTARFINISARGFAGTGPDVLIVGFVISGSSTKTILIRGIGPTLAAYSVTGVMASPQLTVFDAHQNVVGSNDGWGGTAALQAAFNAVSAFALPTTSKDSAMLVTLPPGAYTAQVSGANGSTGVALLEMYEMP